METIDVAIIGGGPAGLQAALVLARTRKNVVVFDAPDPSRNGASHGVHNFLGLDGLLPQDIRDRAWSQIRRYDSARQIREKVNSVRRAEDSTDLIVQAQTAWRARHVLLACGYHDQLPDIDGIRPGMTWLGPRMPAWCPYSTARSRQPHRLLHPILRCGRGRNSAVLSLTAGSADGQPVGHSPKTS